MRQLQLVPCDQTRRSAVHGALGAEGSLGAVAHVDPATANPTVSDYTRRNARRNEIKRADGKHFFD